MKYILIIGAKSDIAKEVSRKYAKKGYNLYLAGKNISEISSFVDDIKIRTGVEAKLKEFDITKFDTHNNFYNELEIKPEGVMIAAGYMEEQKTCELDFEKTINTINVNYTGAVSILNIIANDFESRKSGFIIGISSVAGDRGRKTNYIYGSSKAAFTSYLSGLRNRLFENNVHVLTVKPGFVDTKMTAGLDLPEKLTASPEEVAYAIVKAQEKNKNIIYVKPVWQIIMLIIKHIPEFIFKRLSI
jgi:short-subunit dehydrogenase